MEKYQCSICGGWGEKAQDETDPASDEITIDTRGIASANDLVCGACLEAAEDGESD